MGKTNKRCDLFIPLLMFCFFLLLVPTSFASEFCGWTIGVCNNDEDCNGDICVTSFSSQNLIDLCEAENRIEVAQNQGYYGWCARAGNSTLMIDMDTGTNYSENVFIKVGTVDAPKLRGEVCEPVIVQNYTCENFADFFKKQKFYDNMTYEEFSFSNKSNFFYKECSICEECPECNKYCFTLIQRNLIIFGLMIIIICCPILLYLESPNKKFNLKRFNTKELVLEYNKRINRRKRDYK